MTENFRNRLMRVALGVALVALPSFAQQYHSNDLTPPYSATGKLHGASKGKQVGGGGDSHAYLLSGNALTATDLHPSVGYYSSMATSSDDFSQCGYGYSNLGGIHALKWSGSSNSVVDLHPSGYNFSYCTGVDGNDQGGFAEQQSYFVTASHAMLWHGNSVAVDLHPISSLVPFSRVMGVKAGEEVGYTSSAAYPYGDYLGFHTTSKAVSWHGTADSVVSLHPATGWDASEALSTNGTQQGGWVYNTLLNTTHAALWTGTADSFVDLHPTTGYASTKVTAVIGSQQVGEGWTGAQGTLGSVRHALLWNGTADSVIDLNQYLPAGYTHAVATGVDADGNVVGYAYNTLSQGLYVGGDVIAVVFAPGQAPASSLSTLTVDTPAVIPGGALNATVTLATPAPAGGVAITFLSTNTALAATPAPVTIAEGQDTVTVPVQVMGGTLVNPTTFRLFASDNVVSRSLTVTVKPVVKLASVSVNNVEGGLSNSGVITLTIPAQLGGAVVSLTSGDPTLVTVPATVTVPQGYSSFSFSASTKAVTALTAVTITATMDGVSVSGVMNVSPQPVVTLSSINLPLNLIGGQPLSGAVYLNNWVRNPAGVTVLLNSGNKNVVQTPASVFIPYGYSAANFTATTTAVPSSTTVSVRADLDTARVTASTTVDPIPPVTILTAVWKADLSMLKVDATTPNLTSILTYGETTPFGTMQMEAGLWQGSIVLPAKPATVTVWSSVGGSATLVVSDSSSSTSTGGGGGGGGGGNTGGGGGGGGTTTGGTFTLSAKTSGKGNFVSNPAGISCGSSKGSCSKAFPAGTLVNLTAKPDAGAIFLGWTGDCAGNITSCTVTMDKARSVTANFK